MLALFRTDSEISGGSIKERELMQVCIVPNYLLPSDSDSGTLQRLMKRCLMSWRKIVRTT